MKVLSGTVVGGVIVVEGERLEEGSVVTVLAPDGEESFTLPPGDDVELRARAEAAARGESLTPDQLAERLRRSR